MKQGLLIPSATALCVDPQEQENRDLLNHFKMAHSEVEEREQKLQQVEGINNSIRLELRSSDTERRQLRDTVSNQEREIQQVRHSWKWQQMQEECPGVGCVIFKRSI